ncbi:alkane 1-monooxygenase [Antrihabitans stalactiti]|uniref:Alkane 1-monooxygenase n=1 Tax=Antrihabitans stalactiti TaxID=2584121 RepID=A0A848KCG3_9NOCA|nr:alkane 1-monooxygenase [Antrihabitans stalactiti]NMN93820.1 alkane 1-monooxygenase [Antrihabitans stalactiti]
MASGIETSEWRDRKRWLWTLGLIAPGCSVVPSQLVLWTGVEVFWWIGPIIVFVMIPLIDAVVGDDGVNPPDEVYERLSNDRYYRWCTYAFLPVQVVALFIAGYLWSQNALSVVDKIGMAVTVGVGCGIGINAAHELGHRCQRHERWLAKVALAQSGYGHFYVEHNKGHHARVATPEDPASARFGESLWQFLPRSIVGGLRSALGLERSRLRRNGKHWFSVHNNLLQAWAMTVVLYGILLGVFGWQIAPYLVVQAVVGFCLLETVNYVEHYGLLRRRLPNGSYEQCSPRHSWNSDRLVTNVFLFHLQRHSDHHANPGRRYQTLRTVEEAPQLPAGYASMVVLATIPPLWRHVMDRRVLAHYDGDVSRTNILPSKRARILAHNMSARKV